MSYQASFRVWRGDADDGSLQDFTVEVNEGEVVLDVIHRLQATQAGDLAVRGIEDAQQDAVGIRRGHGKVRARGVEGGTERLGQARRGLSPHALRHRGTARRSAR